MTHSIPLSTNFKLLKYLSISTSANYNEVWTQNIIRYNDFDLETNSVKKDTINKIGAFREYGFSASMGTTIYGTVNFGEDKKIQSIRHTYDQVLVTQIVQALNNIMILILLTQKVIQLNIQDIKIAYLVLQEGIYQIIWL